MTTVENQPLPVPTTEVYDPDDVGLCNTPPLRPMKVNLQPSPSPPPAVPLPKPSPESSPGPPGRKGSNRSKTRPSQGDAVLAHFMGGGNYSEVARRAGDSPLACDNDDAEEPERGVGVNMNAERSEGEGNKDDRTVEQNSAVSPQRNESTIEMRESHVEKEGLDLAVAALAVNRLRQNARAPSEPSPQSNGMTTNDTSKSHAVHHGEPMEDVKPTIPSITATYIDGSRTRSSPETAVKLEMKSSAAGELPPIRQYAPQSGLLNGNGGGPITLPSISDQLGDLTHLTEAPTTGESAFSQSPPARPLPRFAPVPVHGSPPKSPNDTFRRELPSPGRGAFYYGNNAHPRRPSQTDGPQYSSAGDYSSSNTETPSTDQSASTPATGIDRMSIDGITNPQIGAFQCNNPGCTAQPFQTQYLLNSHANVHSSSRPHYCSVKGCPRSEGGKGFKRKNEMIRHGLVHDSPGYVCPFCPDREHKYPRPDNLQRHVRVHHVDKDKDDPQLREVLSQRPEGPSRGRRRRGGTS